MHESSIFINRYKYWTARANLQQAVRLLIENEGVIVKRVSSIYETAAVGFTDQADFLNIAVYVETTLTADEMLIVCQSIENELGRIREFRWGPRIIDLDILLYNNENIALEHLIVPHPRMYERAFVLVPLNEIAKRAFERHNLRWLRTALSSMDLEKEGITKWKSTTTFKSFNKLNSINVLSIMTNLVVLSVKRRT